MPPHRRGILLLPDSCDSWFPSSALPSREIHCRFASIHASGLLSLVGTAYPFRPHLAGCRIPSMLRPHCLFALAVLVFAAPLLSQERTQTPPPAYAGPTAAGFLLPNGWRLTPVGEQVPLTDLPLNIRTTADGKYAIVATSGYN